MNSYDKKSSGLINRLKTASYSAIFTLLIYAIIVNFAPVPIANIFLNPMGVVSGVQYIQEKVLASNAADAEKKFSKAITSHKEEIFDQSAPYLGNKNAKVQIVVFSDYKCGYCRKFDEVASSILQKPEYKDKIKFIIKELPVLGDASYIMAEAALEVFIINPDAYQKVHKALYESEATKKEAVLNVVKEKGVKISLNGNSDAKNLLQKNIKLAAEIGIRATPAIIVGEELIPGFIGEAELISRIQRELTK